MKKLLSFFLVSLVSVYAQQGALRATLNGGPQVSFLFNNDDSNAGPELDYAKTIRMNIGAGVNYGLSDYFRLGLDFMYSAEGQKYVGKDEQTGNSFEAFSKLSYLKIPFYLYFNTDVEQAVHFTFQVGPQLYLLMNYNDTYTTYDKTGTKASFSTVSGTSGTTELGSVSSDFQLTEPIYRKSLIGAFFGLGVGWKMGDYIVAEVLLRFDYGFADVENKNAKYKDDNTDYWAYKPKYDIRGRTPAGYKASDRAQTKTTTGGLQFRIGYIFGQ